MSDHLTTVNSDRDCTPKVAAAETQPQEEERARYRYPTLTKTYDNFRLHVVEGEITESQIIVVLGKNGTGKSTFLRMLAGRLKPDEVESSDGEIPKFNVSYKPQKLSPTCPLTVRDLLHQRIPDSCMKPQFVFNVMLPLHIELFMDKVVKDLSHGARHRVALCLCLGRPADIYLIDQPSAYLDPLQRVVASMVIKRFIHREKKAAVVVEHDLLMASHLADRIIVTEGQPFIDCTANAPGSVFAGMDLFSSQLDNTVGRKYDPTNYWLQSKLLRSTEGREQKAAGSSANASIKCTANALGSVLTGMNLFTSQLNNTVGRKRDPTDCWLRLKKLESTEGREQKDAGSSYYRDEVSVEI